MAETVVKTVENVDLLFSEIVVNGESHVSDRYVEPEPDEPVTPVNQEETPQQSEEETPSQEEVVGDDVYAVELNDILHNLRDPTFDEALNAEITARREGDQTLQGEIDHIDNLIPSEAGVANKLADKEYVQGINTALQEDIDAVENDVSDIQDLIPNQASDQNQLADKSFVNSSIATNTANFIGTFESVTQLRAYSGTVTNNDYAFVRNTVVQYNGGDFPNVTTLNSYDKTLLTNGDYAWVVNSEDNTKYDLYRFDIVEQSWVLRNAKIDKSPDVLNSFFNRYKATVSGSTVTWAYEYTLNNSSFTASQWATINSGLTQQSVDQDIADALSSTKQVVTSSQAFTVTNDIKILVNASGVTVTLNFDSEEGAVAKVFAFQACTVTYYTAQGTTATLSMSAGTTAVFIYFNGWKFNGIYGAVWN